MSVLKVYPLKRLIKNKADDFPIRWDVHRPVVSSFISRVGSVLVGSCAEVSMLFFKLTKFSPTAAASPGKV